MCVFVYEFILIKKNKTKRKIRRRDEHKNCYGGNGTVFATELN